MDKLEYCGAPLKWLVQCKLQGKAETTEFVLWEDQVDSENMEADTSCGCVLEGKEVATTGCSEGKCDWIKL